MEQLKNTMEKLKKTMENLQKTIGKPWKNWRKPGKNWRNQWKNWRTPWKTCRKQWKIEENHGKLKKTMEQLKKTMETLKKTMEKLKKTMEKLKRHEPQKKIQNCKKKIPKTILHPLSCVFSVHSAGLPFNPWPILASQSLSSAKATHHGRMVHPAKLRLEMQDTLDHLCRLLLVKQDPQGNEKLMVCETSWICVGSTPFRQTPLGIPQIQIAPIRRRIQRPIPRRMAHRLAAAQNKFCGAAQC